MNRSVKDMAELFGVSVRTLHYYDEIGLLKPAAVTDAGYRFYGAAEEERLSLILFYRELEFSLSQIESILSDPRHDGKQALSQQRDLLLKKRERIDALLTIVTKSMEGETVAMEQFDFQSLEKTRKQYAAEAQERYGKTPAYQESEKRTAGYGKVQWMAIQAEADDIFRGFAKRRDEAPASEPVQALVKSWQDHITKHYYACTNEILSGLGEMYVADARFTENIDRFGDGTAQMMRDAIRVYCNK